MPGLLGFYKVAAKVLDYLDAWEKKHFSGPTSEYANSSPKAADAVAGCGMLVFVMGIILGAFTIALLPRLLLPDNLAVIFSAVIVLLAGGLLNGGIYLITLSNTEPE